MTALGQKQTRRGQIVMSAYPRKRTLMERAGIPLWARNGLMQSSKLPSFDHFVGGGEQRLGPTIVLWQARR